MNTENFISVDTLYTICVQPHVTVFLQELSYMNRKSSPYSCLSRPEEGF